MDWSTGDRSPFTWSGQRLTLTTTEKGSNMEFCINAVAPNAANDTSNSFTVNWTDSGKYSAANYRTDGVMFSSTVNANKITTYVSDVG